MNNEDLKFYLASPMHSFASLILNTLLDKRFYNEFNHTGLVSINCRQDLIELSSSALKNEIWALKGKKTVRETVKNRKLTQN